MHFSKYEALGNDYLVSAVDADGGSQIEWTAKLIRRICDRHFGIGSDGILVGTTSATNGVFQLRILNPDGTEAEKSGNGLRIYAKYLWDLGAVGDELFQVSTLGGMVHCQVVPEPGSDSAKKPSQQIDVAMGAVSFQSEDIPVTGPAREVLREKIVITDETGQTHSLEISAATIGNPHCVVVRDTLDVTEVHQLGALLETYVLFPERTNVQFMRVVDRSNIQIEIWERGAGYTLASGSSSSAAAAVAKRLDLVDEVVTVHMPGGTLRIEIDDAYQVQMRGPASKIADIKMAPQWLSH